MIFLLASGAVAMLNLFVALLTAMRKQKRLLFAYAAASLLLLLAGPCHTRLEHLPSPLTGLLITRKDL